MRKLHSDLGSSTAAEISATAVSAYGARPDAQRAPHEILAENVISIAKKRLSGEDHATETNGFAVFLATDDLRRERIQLAAHHTPALDNAGQKLSGYAWLVPPTLLSGARLELLESDLGKVFAELEKLGLGDRLAIVVDFTDRHLRIYPSGVVEDAKVIKLPIGNDSLDTVALEDILQDFADHFVGTPDAQNASLNVWQDGEAYIPIRLAEKKIQDHLDIYLRSRLHETHKIELEYPLASGRVDLVINRKDGGSWTKLASVEMKVVRTFSSTGRATPQAALIKHIAKGFRQAQAYRDELEAIDGYLIVYDLRKIDDRSYDLLAVHRDAAKAAKIMLRCDDVYGTAEDYRVAKYG